MNSELKDKIFRDIQRGRGYHFIPVKSLNYLYTYQDLWLQSQALWVRYNWLSWTSLYSSQKVSSYPTIVPWWYLAGDQSLQGTLLPRHQRGSPWEHLAASAPLSPPGRHSSRLAIVRSSSPASSAPCKHSTTIYGADLVPRCLVSSLGTKNAHRLLPGSEITTTALHGNQTNLPPGLLRMRIPTMVQFPEHPLGHLAGKSIFSFSVPRVRYEAHKVKFISFVLLCGCLSCQVCFCLHLRKPLPWSSLYTCSQLHMLNLLRNLNFRSLTSVSPM